MKIVTVEDVREQLKEMRRLVGTQVVRWAMLEELKEIATDKTVEEKAADSRAM